MSWRVERTYFENCSCDMVCPCTTSSLALPGDTGRCLVALFFQLFNVASGGVEGSDVSGLTVAETRRASTCSNTR